MIMRILLIFLDGVGVGISDADVNPFARARLDSMTQFFGSSAVLTSDARCHAQNASFIPLDATLGVAGLPQSGTGQTALLTGINAAQEFGRHFGPWVPTALRERLANENVLSTVKRAGGAVAFANAYPEELFDAPAPAVRDRAGRAISDPLRAGPPIAALGAGVLTRHTAQLMTGDAVASEITNDGWRKHLHRTQLPVISAEEAGRNLARIASHHQLTLFAHYATDYVGHRGHMWEAVDALQKIDEFLGGVRAAMSEETTVIVASDHGNIEDIRAGHTTNPAIGMTFGAAHREAAEDLHSLIDVAPRVLQLLSISTP